MNQGFLIVRLVTVHVKARKVTIKGERGEITKDFSHLAVELQKMKQDNKKRQGTYLRIRMWFGGMSQACAVKTLQSLLSNMITGVTEVSSAHKTNQQAEPSRLLLRVWDLLLVS